MAFISRAPSRMLSGWTKSVSPKTQLMDRFKLPERYKGTVIEKWANYWKQLLIDYKEMIFDTGRWVRDNQKKAAIYGIIGTGSYLLNHANPTLDDFKTHFLRASNELILVHESCQNPVAAKHVKDIELWYNSGVIRRLSLGVISFIWLADFDKDVALYKARCEYLQPQYMTFDQRVIDVGFLNKFWILESKMLDYDVNFPEP